MISPISFSSFVDEMEKSAGIWNQATTAVGKAVAPQWHRLLSAEKAIRSPTIGGAVAKRVLPGAALGAAGGAAYDSDNRLRGALLGAAGGGAAGALAPGALKELHATGRGVGQLIQAPIKTLKAGWHTQSPLARIGTKDKATGIVKSKAETAYEGAVQNIKDYQPGMIAKWRHGGEQAAKDVYKTKRLKGVEHLVDPVTGQQRQVAPSLLRHIKAQQGIGGKIKGTAEELSRRGWTGQGQYTKYLPGSKAMTVGFAGLSAPTVYNAATGEVPWSEAAGELGSNLGFMAAGAVPGLGMAGSMALSQLAGKAFSAPVSTVIPAAKRTPQEYDDYEWAGQRNKHVLPVVNQVAPVKDMAHAGTQELHRQGVW